MAVAVGAALAPLAGCAADAVTSAAPSAEPQRREEASELETRAATGADAPEGRPAEAGADRFEPTRAVLSVDYSPAATHASNQMAAWVERGDGSLLKTLYVTGFTAVRRGYRERPDALSRWVALADPETMGDAEVDAVSSATPAGGRLSFEWDFTDEGGERVPDGAYRLVFEATLFWSSNVRYEAAIDTGGLRPGPLAVGEVRSEPGDETNADMVGIASAVVE